LSNRTFVMALGPKPIAGNGHRLVSGSFHNNARKNVLK
jgi:hypothetical protein